MGILFLEIEPSSSQQEHFYLSVDKMQYIQHFIFLIMLLPATLAQGDGCCELIQVYYETQNAAFNIYRSVYGLYYKNYDARLANNRLTYTSLFAEGAYTFWFDPKADGTNWVVGKLDE